MFTAIFRKEWKEKALLFFFELGILVILLAAEVVFLPKKDLQEWLAYAVLLIFFPFGALILGVAGFEAEYRQGAWAYLFSRPVRKGEIWLAKFSALLTMLGTLWLVFAAVWLAVPGIRELVGGPRVLLGVSIDAGFPFWSLWQSAFLLTVAYSLSLLHERQFNVLFMALIVGVGLTAAAWVLLVTRAYGYLAWLPPSKILATFVVGQALVALAFAAASILTLARSDFSQPRKQMTSFARRVAPFLILAVAGTAAWAMWSPVGGRRWAYFQGTSGGELYYAAHNGIFKYSQARDRIQWLWKAKRMESFFGPTASVSGGMIVYTRFIIKGRNDAAEELWAVNADGSGRRPILRPGPGQNDWPPEDRISGLLVSPDGTKVAILDSSAYGRHRPRTHSPVWIAHADGSSLENVTGDSALFGDPSEQYYLRLVAWVQDGRALLLSRSSRGVPPAESFWRYDLDRRSVELALDDAARASWPLNVSPRGDLLPIKYRKSPEAPWGLALLDLKTLTPVDIPNYPGTAEGSWLETAWDPAGDRLAWVDRRKRPDGQFDYTLTVFSVADGKAVAESSFTKPGTGWQITSPAWTSDGTELLVLDGDSRSLRILGPDLRETAQIALPPSILTPVSLNVAGRHAVLTDFEEKTLWRLDLEKKLWKRIY